MPTLDDERYEAYLKQFRPLVPDALPAKESAPSIRRRRWTLALECRRRSAGRRGDSCGSLRTQAGWATAHECRSSRGVRAIEAADFGRCQRFVGIVAVLSGGAGRPGLSPPSFHRSTNENKRTCCAFQGEIQAMKQLNTIGSVLLAAALLIGPAFAQRKESLGENAALRYWAAFSQLQDAAITDQQAKELNSALENLGAHDLSKYADLVQKNAPALEIMARGTSLSRCDWGLDYGLGENTPVDYARRALALGRLNVLYAIQLYHSGDPEHAIHALVAGLRFSRDVGNGGSFFATLVAKDLLVTHLMAVDAALRIGRLSAAQRSEIQAALAGLGNGLDWAAAAKLDLDVLRAHFGGDGQNSPLWAAFARPTLPH